MPCHAMTGLYNVKGKKIRNLPSGQCCHGILLCCKSISNSYFGDCGKRKKKIFKYKENEREDNLNTKRMKEKII